MTILLVDSDKKALDLAMRRFTQRPFAVTVSLHSSANDAIRFSMCHDVDMVFTRDVLMDMTGQELVANKVRMLSLMGGCFNSRTRREFNVRFDVLSARYVFDNWPTDIIVSPWELGARIFFRAEVLQGLRYASPHPLDVAYRNFLQMPYDRECWDLTSVIAGVDGCNGQFHTSRKGYVEVSDDGVTVFVPDPDGKVTVLSVSEDRRKDLEAFIENMIIIAPEKYEP